MSDMHSDTERALTFPCDGRHVLCACIVRDMSNPGGARLNVRNVCLYSFAQGRDLMKPGSCSMSDIKNVIRSRQVASLRRQDTNVNASNERTPGAVRSRAACTRLYVYCTLTEVRTGTRPGRVRVRLHVRHCIGSFNAPRRSPATAGAHLEQGTNDD